MFTSSAVAACTAPTSDSVCALQQLHTQPSQRIRCRVLLRTLQAQRTTLQVNDLQFGVATLSRVEVTGATWENA